MTYTELAALGQAGQTSDVAAAIVALEERQQLRIDSLNEHTFPILVATPDVAHRDLLDLEAFDPNPRRRKGVVAVYSAESFVNVHADLVAEAATARVYADEASLALVAILNDDTSSGAGWRDHRIELQLRATPEWSHWKNHQSPSVNQLLDQQTFAEVIEEGLPEIVRPTAAEMLELAQTFVATIGSKVRQGGLLANGRRQFEFSEDIDAHAGEDGQTTIPDSFDLRMVPFIGGQPVDVSARLRYRVREGKLRIGYVLVRPHEVEAEAFAGIRSAVAEAVGPIVEGVAPGPRGVSAVSTRL